MRCGTGYEVLNCRRTLLFQFRDLSLQPVEPVKELIEGSSLHRFRCPNYRVPRPTQPPAKSFRAFLVHSPLLLVATPVRHLREVSVGRHLFGGLDDTQHSGVGRRELFFTLE
jgi:hypothetical protein